MDCGGVFSKIWLADDDSILTQIAVTDFSLESELNSREWLGTH